MIWLLDDNHRFCLACAAIDKVDSTTLVCDECGSKQDPVQYNSLYSFGADCVEYGQLYREMYERDKANGNASSRYSLPPFDQLLIFAGVSAISGIIGNLAYDTIKAAIQKIVKSAKKDDSKQNDLFSIQFLRKEQNIDVFIDNINLYLQGLPGVDPAVKAAIAEEQIVHEMQRMAALRKKPLATEELLDPVLMQKAFKKAIISLNKRRAIRPTKKQFKQVLSLLKNLNSHQD
ncbi:hypothetical protein [Prosthecobacter fluviatilis]|uniref:Uncharacterized protein n=1 Tax=Prosthecobacter fluviatilis TaxID=445931 RepID=A0ABW0KYD8_9BACT